MRAKCETYEQWMTEQGIPIYRDYFVEDARTIKLEPWTARECNAAFLQLHGQEGTVEARVTEIPAGRTLPPVKVAVDEAVYVLQGTGQTVAWSEPSRSKSFEWSSRSLFFMPRNTWYQLSSMQGAGSPVRLLHVSYLPLAMAGINDPEFLFNNMHTNAAIDQDGLFSQAQSLDKPEDGFRNVRVQWVGNFFPDLGVWSELVPHTARGSGGLVVDIRFMPQTELSAHMSVFPPLRYKKAHRHGAGTVIVIPAGEGYSLLWEEGKDKIVCPWHEGSVFVPPDMYFHQHFNVGAVHARYLAFAGPPLVRRGTETMFDKRRDQIEYPSEDPWVRSFFESQLAERGLTSRMPDEAYRDAEYKWTYDAPEVEAAR